MLGVCHDGSDQGVLILAGYVASLRNAKDCMVWSVWSVLSGGWSRVGSFDIAEFCHFRWSVVTTSQSGYTTG